MRSGSYQQSSYAQRTSPRRRAFALVAAIIANVLLLILLLRLAPGLQPPPVRPDLATFRLLPDAGAAAAEATKAKAKRGGGAVMRKSASKPAASAPPPPVPTRLPLNMITLSREDYAAGDIAKLPSHSDASAQSSADAGPTSGAVGDSAFAEGQGPNGERMYKGDWYRHPTRAEVDPYLPHDMPEKWWAVIECQTAERFHVENCHELADSQPGSGLARAIREAAWQFLLRPPRRGGKSLIGVPVFITYTYDTITSAK